MISAQAAGEHGVGNHSLKFLSWGIFTLCAAADCSTRNLIVAVEASDFLGNIGFLFQVRTGKEGTGLYLRQTCSQSL